MGRTNYKGMINFFKSVGRLFKVFNYYLQAHNCQTLEGVTTVRTYRIREEIEQKFRSSCVVHRSFWRRYIIIKQ